MGRKRNLRVRKGYVFAGVSRDIPRPQGLGLENIEMNRIGTFRIALVALIPIVAIAFGSAALAQTPAPAASPTATPAPAASPVPPPAETKSPADTPSAAQTPAPPPIAPVQTADPFGEQFTLEPKKVVVMKGTANWDGAFDTLIESFKALTALLDK